MNLLVAGNMTLFQNDLMDLYNEITIENTLAVERHAQVKKSLTNLNYHLSQQEIKDLITNGFVSFILTFDKIDCVQCLNAKIADLTIRTGI